MSQWLYIFDTCQAEFFADRWKESVEAELADDLTPEAFDEYCRENDIHIPDVWADAPACLRDINWRQESRNLRFSLALLREHRAGNFSCVIEPLLALVAVPDRSKDEKARVRDTEMWDDQPLPNWLLAFHPGDAIVQAFDEEASHAYESSHAPTWFDSFNPADVKDLRRVLRQVERYVTVNRHLAAIQRQIEKKWSKDRGSTDCNELDNHL